MPLEARDDGANIILLCPTCHEIVDNMNAADVFTPEVLHQWKRDHERRVRHGAAIPSFEARQELNSDVTQLLHENRGIWQNLGPDSSAANDPLSEAAAHWQDRVLHAIIPNNRRILELIDANRDLLREDELATVENFRVHAAALDLNYNSGRWRADAPRFPEPFPSLFERRPGADDVPPLDT